MESEAIAIGTPKRPWKLIIFGILLFIFSVFGGFALRVVLALKNISTPNDNQAPAFSLPNLFSPGELKGEGDGRINILLLGVGGTNHPGGNLADTIQVVSIDPKNKQLAMLSLPRDLLVSIPGAGSNKINYAHAYGEQNPQKTGGGPKLMKEVVGNVLDLPIHYYARIDFQGFEKIVDALGGIDIYVEKSINDPFYPAPDMIRYQPFSISAGQHHLDGKTALKYSRSRETTSDFDRSRRQQQVLQAIKNKALSLGVVGNPAKIAELAQIVGVHFRTNLSTVEIARGLELSRDASQYKIVSKVLDNSPGGLLVSVNEGGYFLKPRSGNFKEIQRLAHEIFAEPYVTSEQAKIEVVNASGSTQTLSEAVSLLRTYGYTVASQRTSGEVVERTIIYDYSAGTKPYTVNFLSQRFSVSVSLQTRPQNSAADLAFVIGKDFKERLSYK
jgi:LCP family protein required for cell wall assembly